ncbi:hypothetical protein L2089_15510 [Paenibacillus hunanensis]|uniref:hypothetical protein n=1 Tax=Paenibacillus hunanensis TaxID=539262 RepID=UPI00202721B7|nr:hypothetical protein [Paenibacillus hunanensis]MCL9662101.1 hypothetical protein [Paenibacillus hunanensis]
MKNNKRNSALSELSVESLDILFQAMTKGEMLESLPVIKIPYQIIKVVKDFKEKRFIRKLDFFLKNLSQTTTEEREKFINSFTTSTKKEDFYDGLLNHINGIDSMEKIAVLSELFSNFTKEKVTQREFYKLAKSLEDIFFEDLQYLKFAYGKSYISKSTKGTRYYIFSEDPDLLLKNGLIIENTGLSIVPEKIDPHNFGLNGLSIEYEQYYISKLGLNMINYGLANI